VRLHLGRRRCLWRLHHWRGSRRSRGACSLNPCIALRCPDPIHGCPMADRAVNCRLRVRSWTPRKGCLCCSSILIGS
jgi:hypothetical protein